MPEARVEEAIARIRSTPVWHPFLLALCPIVGLYAQNVGNVPLGVVVRPAIVLLASALLLWWLFWWLLKNRDLGGLVASLFLVGLVIVWGVLEDLIQVIVPVMGGRPPWHFYLAYAGILAGVLGLLISRFNLRREGDGVLIKWIVIALVLGTAAAVAMSPIFGRRAAFLIAAYLLVLAVLGVSVARYKGDLQLATRTGNGFSVILLILYATVILYNRPPDPPPPPSPIEPVPPVAEGVALPDIYLIALDGYARADALRTLLEYDNEPSLSALRERGFQVAGSSVANYADTRLALAACLNMDYLEDLVPADRLEAAGQTGVLHLFHRNRLVPLLKDLGYRTYAFSSGVESLELRENIDRVLSPPGSPGEFEMVLLNRSVVSRVMQAWYFLRYHNPAYWGVSYRSDRIQYTVETMGDVASRDPEEPKFVFAHLPIPAAPFLFTREGERAQPHGPGSLAIDRDYRGSPQDYVAQYLDQLHYTNELLIEAIDAIDEAAQRPTVVVVVSSGGLPPTLTREGIGRGNPYANLIALRVSDPILDSPIPRQLNLIDALPHALNQGLGIDLPTHDGEPRKGEIEQPYLPLD